MVVVNEQSRVPPLDVADTQQRLATERLLQPSIQICIDLAAQVVSEQSAAPPSYSDVFKILGNKDVISPDIADRLGNAARQRNLLVRRHASFRI